MFPTQSTPAISEGDVADKISRIRIVRRTNNCNSEKVRGGLAKPSESFVGERVRMQPPAEVDHSSGFEGQDWSERRTVQAMTDADYQELGLLAKTVIVVAAVLFVTGVFWHGISLKVFEQFWHDLIERPDGPMRFRFVLQPVIATVVAIRDGLEDARAGRSPYLATVLGNRQERIGRLREGLNATARIIALGLVMDVIYQAVVFKTFYPDQALVVALVLAFVPYLIIRGVIARIWRGQPLT